jgi:ABC-type branched-subunit amino acid transport system substrate-binding protein
MKTQKVFILFMGVVVLLWACAPKPVVTPGIGTGLSEDELFSMAEDLFEAGDYDQALVHFDEYIRLFADKPMAAAALMKIGIIHALNGNYDDARDAYRKIPSKYPASVFVQDALVEELFTYYQQGRYLDVLEHAPETLARIESTDHIFRIYALIGDTYMAKGAPVDAIDFYVRAREVAPDHDRAALSAKLKEAIARLDSADIADLLAHPEEGLPLDYLLFQLGLNYAMEEKYEAALRTLKEFTDRYPENENRTLVDSLIAEIEKNAVFERYTIGCLLPLSGPYQSFGQRALKGIELAVAQFSSKIANPPINIIVKDTGADADKTIEALEELYRNKVAAILGPIVTSEIAAREAQSMGIPIITLTQKDNIPEIGDKVFRNFITPKMQVEALATFTVGALGLNRFAILYPDENYGVTFMNLFWDELLKWGAKIVAVEAYQPEQTDYTDAIKKLVGLYYEIPEDLKPEEVTPDVTEEVQPTAEDSMNDETVTPEEEEEPQPIVDFDAVFIPDSPGKAGQIVPQLAYFDIKNVYLLGTNLWHSESLVKIAAEYVQGAVMPDGFFAESDSPLVRNFVEAFEETYQETPGFIEAVVYDSAMILFNVVGRPQIQFRNDIRDELLNLDNFPGVTGTTRFDENGDVRKRMHLLRIKGRRFVELK